MITPADTIQSELRYDICRIILPYLEKHKAHPKLAIEAAAACMGACAVALACIPDKEERHQAAKFISENLAILADQHRKDIFSGKFDRRFQ